MVASYGIALRREGAGTYRALCPFHQEHTPSFWIDAREVLVPTILLWLLGARRRGDVRDGARGLLVYGGLRTTVYAWSSAGARTRDPRERTTPSRVWEELDGDSDEGRLLDEALRVYEEHLWQSDRALEYLRRRGIPEEVARAQRLGYADGHRLLHWLHNSPAADAHIQTAVALGLVLERPGSAMRIRPSRILPGSAHCSGAARRSPIWLIGRAIEDTAIHLPRICPTPPLSRRPVESRPKYLGLPGEKPVIGLEHVAGRRTAFICEGPLDWLAAVSWKLPAFAICGTHFPLERLPSLGNALAVYGVFDPDRAGQSAAERFAPLFGSRWRPVRLPHGLDLAELAALGEAGHDMFNVAVGRARAAAWQQGRV